MSESPYKQLLIDELARLTRIDNHRINQLISEKTTDKSMEHEKNIVRTPMRIATAILLQHPEIYAACSTEIPPSLLHDESQHILQALMLQIIENPAINTAALIEAWRDSPFFDSLNKLAAWEHQVPEDALAKEFSDIILFIVQQQQENKIRYLLEKSRKNGLTDDDRHTLKRLLKQRHQMHKDN